jgi:hypothetical protein
MSELSPQVKSHVAPPKPYDPQTEDINLRDVLIAQAEQFGGVQGLHEMITGFMKFVNNKKKMRGTGIARTVDYDYRKAWTDQCLIALVYQGRAKLGGYASFRDCNRMEKGMIEIMKWLDMEGIVIEATCFRLPVGDVDRIHQCDNWLQEYGNLHGE